MSDNSLQKAHFHGRAELGFDTIVLIVLSSVLACIALLSSSVPVLIGAMILAPVFDPLVAIPFALINRDWKLLRLGTVSSLILFATSFVAAILTVFLLRYTNVVPPELRLAGPNLIDERLIVGWHSGITAIAAGAGGAIASATNMRQNLVGVVVALALVPAIAASAIGFFYKPLDGFGGLLLFGVHVIGIIISGAAVLMFRSGAGRAQDEAGKRHR